MRLLLTSIAAATSLAALSLCSVAHAQGISIGPGGVGIDTGVEVGRGYRDYRGDGEYRHHRDHGREYGYNRRRFRDQRDEGDGGYRRHHHDDFEQDSEQ